MSVQTNLAKLIADTQVAITNLQAVLAALQQAAALVADPIPAPAA